jgi:hypothetical protein
MNLQDATIEANSMTKEDIINHYRNYYSLSFDEYEEMETMDVQQLRNMFIEGETQ